MAEMEKLGKIFRQRYILERPLLTEQYTPKEVGCLWHCSAENSFNDCRSMLEVPTWIEYWRAHKPWWPAYSAPNERAWTFQQSKIRARGHPIGFRCPCTLQFHFSGIEYGFFLLNFWSIFDDIQFRLYRLALEIAHAVTKLLTNYATVQRTNKSRTITNSFWRTSVRKLESLLHTISAQFTVCTIVYGVR